MAHAVARDNALLEVKTMNIFPISKDGELAIAFELENIYISRKSIAKILKRIDGVADVHLRGHLGSSDEIRIEFKYMGRDFIVWEPYGDNSRYWVGPKNIEQAGLETTDLQAAFIQYKPPLYRALLGDLLTFRLFRLNTDRR